MAEASLRGSAVDVELNPKVFDLTTSAGFVILDAISFRSTHVGPEFLGGLLDTKTRAKGHMVHMDSKKPNGL